MAVLRDALQEAVDSNSKPTLTGISLRFGIAMVSTVGFLWLILELGGYIFKREFLAGTGLLGAASVVLLSAFLSSVYVFIYVYQRIDFQERVIEAVPVEEQPPVEEKPEDTQLTETLLADLQAAYQEERWEEVLKIGSVLSRPLWVTGKYRLRVELGKLVEPAAAYSYHPDQQASALIDDLGWTLFVLEEVREAEHNIEHGIRIAERCGNYYLAYKGHRHLSGMAMKKGNLDEAIAHHMKSQEYAQKIQDEAVKNEVVAGLHVNQALLDMEKRNWERALQELGTAQKMYRELGDKDREVKLQHFKGDVLYEMGHPSAAKDTYREGLSASKQQSRKDGILKNNIGLAKVAILEGDLVEARNAYLRAAETARDLGRETLAEELEANASKLPAKPIDIKF